MDALWFYINNVKSWERNPSIIGKILVSGFNNISTQEFPNNMKHRLHLLDLIVENYNKERRCFILNGIPLVFSLKDVLFITSF